VREWKFEGCPHKIITPQSQEYLHAYVYHDRKQFPNVGGWADQSPKYLAAMELIERELIRIEESKGRV
jgi:hypothetical protein